MGIRGLMTFIKHNMSSVSSFFTRDSSDSVAVIVVDGNAYTHWLCSRYLGPCPYILSDYTLIHRAVNEFLEICNGLKIRLVFVFDGPTDSNRLSVKLSRLQNQCDVLRSTLESKPYSYASSVPPPLLSVECISMAILSFQPGGGNESDTHTLLRAYGEADRDIISVANSVGAVAILSNDSDLLAYNYSRSSGRSEEIGVGLIPLWTLEYSACSGISAHVVDRVRLSRSTGVLPQHMWLLSALLGHDTTPAPILERIHALLLVHSRNVNNSGARQQKSSARKKKKKQKKKRKCEIDTKECHYQDDIYDEADSGVESCQEDAHIDCDIEAALSVLQQYGPSSCADNDYVMTSPDTLKAAHRLLTDVYRLWPGVSDISVSVISCLLDISTQSIQNALTNSRCRGLCQWVRNDQGPRWSPCCSNTAVECRRLATYLSSTEAMYTVNSNSVSHSQHDSEVVQFVSHYPKKISNSMGDNNLPWDLRLVIRHRIYLPRVSLCENAIDISFEDSDITPSCSVYAALRSLRSRVYALLLGYFDCREGVIREVLFSTGEPVETHVSVPKFEAKELKLDDDFPQCSRPRFIQACRYMLEPCSIASSSESQCMEYSIVKISLSVLCHIGSLVYPSCSFRPFSRACCAIVTGFAGMLVYKDCPFISNNASYQNRRYHSVDECGIDMCVMWSIVEVVICHIGYVLHTAEVYSGYVEADSMKTLNSFLNPWLFRTIVDEIFSSSSFESCQSMDEVLLNVVERIDPCIDVPGFNSQTSPNFDVCRKSLELWDFDVTGIL